MSIASKLRIRNPFEYFFGSRRLQCWHRTFDPSWTAVDIDLVGTERGRVAYVIESTKSSVAGKNYYTTENIARACDAYGFVVQIPSANYVVPDDMTWGEVCDCIVFEEVPDEVVVRKVWPKPEWIRTFTWPKFEELLGWCRDAKV